MRPIDSIKFNHQNPLKDHSLNDLRQDKDLKQNHIEAIKNKISSIGVEREDCDCSHDKDKSSDFFDIFRQVKKGFMNIINMFHQTGEIDKDDYKEKKSDAKEFFQEFGSNVKKLFLNIAQRDLESQLEYIDSKIAGTESSTELDDAHTQEQKIQEENKATEGKNLQLTLTSTLKFNNLGNSLLNLLNKVDPFQSPDEVDPSQKQTLTEGINNTHAKTRELILSLDPSLKDDLDNIDKKVEANPDKKEAYLNYSVAMIPIDIASKAIDVVNNEREGYQELANKDRKTLSADMLDFYEYLSNLKQNL